MNFYANIPQKRVDQAQLVVSHLTRDNAWFERMSKVFDPVWDQFEAFWKKITGETPTKMSFYTSHNGHWIAEWASAKHPELLARVKVGGK